MFLVERLFGVGVFAYFLIAVCVLLAYTKVSRRGILFFYLIVLSAMAFFYEPYVTADLYRINETMSLFATFSLSSFWNTFVSGSSIPSARLLFWLIGRTGCPELLPLVTTIITYSCIFYVLDKSSTIYSASRVNVAISLLFVMSAGTYFIVISNIRTVMALSLICFCFFRESVEKKRSVLHIPIYLVAITLHNMAIVVFVLRLLTPVIASNLSVLKRGLYLIFILGFAVVSFVVFESQLQEVTLKAEEYLLGDMYSYAWDYLIGVLSVLIQLSLLAKTRRRAFVPAALREMRVLLFLCVLTSLIFCFEFTLFHRFATYVSPILAMPLLISTLQAERYGGRRAGRISYRELILFASVLILIIACARGSLCGLKFFVL